MIVYVFDIIIKYIFHYVTLFACDTIMGLQFTIESTVGENIILLH